MSGSPRTSVQQRFIKDLFSSYGGPAKVTRIINQELGTEFSRQEVKNWQRRAVPLKHVIRVSKALNVSPYALNYEAFSELLGKKIPWDRAIKARFERLEIG